MKVRDLIKKLETLDQDVDITVAGKNSCISYSNIEIKEVCFDDLAEYNSEEEYLNEKFIECYILRPKQG